MVEMTCMTTKKKFEVENPEAVRLRNGRYAYRTPCPWDGKGGKKLIAFKFCSAAAYEEYTKSKHSSESEHIEDGHSEASEGEEI